MRVNIVTENPRVGRIKLRISEKIVKYNCSDVVYSISDHPIDYVDLNFYVCYNEFLAFGPSRVKNVCWVTHVYMSIAEHERVMGRSFQMFNYADAFLHMSNRTVEEFKIANIAQNKYHEVVWCGIEEEAFRPTINIGIIQNGESVGKGMYFMESIFNESTIDKFDNFKFIFQGVGWESVVNKLNNLGIRNEYYPSLDYKDYPNIYSKLDYMLIPSICEGGPMAVLEAMYCGIPIISSDVGWVKEIAPQGYFYNVGNVNELIEIFKVIDNKHIVKYDHLERYTCRAFSTRLYNSFKKILSMK